MASEPDSFSLSCIHILCAWKNYLWNISSFVLKQLPKSVGLNALRWPIIDDPSNLRCQNFMVDILKVKNFTFLYFTLLVVRKIRGFFEF